MVDNETLLKQLNDRLNSANNRQVGGEHYKKDGALQHWDVVVLMDWDYFQGNITKYVDRHRRKKGFEDLQKAMHYLEKYMEVEYPEEWAAYKGTLITITISETDDEDDSENDMLFGSLAEQEPTETAEGEVHCRKCGKEGHINIDCPFECGLCCDTGTPDGAVACTCAAGQQWLRVPPNGPEGTGQGGTGPEGTGQAG